MTPRIGRRTLLRGLATGSVGTTLAPATARGKASSGSKVVGLEATSQSAAADEPFVQTQTLAPDDPTGEFGRGSIAVSNGTALVGTRWNQNVYGNQPGPGSVTVYDRTSDGWTQQTTLSPRDGDGNDIFGWTVALDGDTAIIGAEWTATSESVYVFERRAGAWTQQTKLTPDDGITGLFGDTVALSGDTALVGARNDDDPNGILGGSAYVFHRDGGTWTQQAKLVPSDGDAEDLFGWGISISGDTALVGARGHTDPNGEDAGAAYVFARSGGQWTQQAKLVPDDGDVGAEFGEAVAVSGDTALVGARGDRAVAGSDVQTGSAYVFERTQGTWTQQTKLVPDDNEANLFSDTLALVGDTALVESNNSDTAYVFGRDGDAWTQENKLALDWDTTGGIESMALGEETALLRTQRDDGAPDQATYVFERGGAQSYETQSGERTETESAESTRSDDSSVTIFEQFGDDGTLPLAVLGGVGLGGLGLGAYRRYGNDDEAEREQ